MAAGLCLADRRLGLVDGSSNFKLVAPLLDLGA